MNYIPHGLSSITVHPHARGEDGSGGGVFSWVVGSPPRTWGRWAEAASELGCLRFTPTHVGKIWSMLQQSSQTTVHPHARGEDSGRGASPRVHVGSPPRTWGRCTPAIPHHPGTRFTPTHVGKMVALEVKPHPCTVHPHARGEDGRPRSEAAPMHGSPPRTWGRWAGCRSGAAAQAVHPHARGEDGTGNALCLA